MKSFPSPTFVKSLAGFKIYLEYSDNTKGIIDLKHLAHKGVFVRWDENINFKNVYINNENSTIAWDDVLEICPNAQYLKLIGKSFEEWLNTNANYA